MIKINNITKKYGETVIFENASYTFPQNGIICLMGASGGGKTTLLNLLAGFDTDYSGEILVASTPINSMDEDTLCRYRRDNIGFVFQNYHLLTGYTVLENVQLACGLSGSNDNSSSSQSNLQKAKSLLSRLGISEKESQKVENLSGGQKQRVAIARALINNPQIILADEPTGALDRTTSTEIMTILREISKKRLVIVITHDQKICDFADEIIRIKGHGIIAEYAVEHCEGNGKMLANSASIKMSTFARGLKNFKVHIKRYIAVSIAISVGIVAFLLSLSFGNVMENSISDFKEKNTSFNNGYIKGTDDGVVLEYLNNDERIENVYYQYKLGEIAISIGKKTELLAEKFPTPKATESLSYGVMPRNGMNEISITPSLAKKFSSDIKSLLGKEMILELGGASYTLTVSGIYNAGYDDFFVSSDIEQQFYQGIINQSNYSISYDVKNFNDIIDVSNTLNLRGLTTNDAASEVYVLQNTFSSLSKLFMIISVLILIIGLFICAVLLIKLQNTRYREVGLLSALGFSRKQIASMISVENQLLSVLATGINLVFLGLSVIISSLLKLPFIVTVMQIGLSIIVTFIIVMLMSNIASYKLVRTEPATALRH